MKRDPRRLRETVMYPQIIITLVCAELNIIFHCEKLGTGKTSSQLYVVISQTLRKKTKEKKKKKKKKWKLVKLDAYGCAKTT